MIFLDFYSVSSLKQHIQNVPILKSLVWPHRCSNARPTKLEASTLTIICGWSFVTAMYQNSIYMYPFPICLCRSNIFLMQHHQRVVVEGEFSLPCTMDSVVTQGTILGPLLFLYHINDFPQHVKSRVRLFADDCISYRSKPYPTKSWLFTKEDSRLWDEC